MCEIQFVKRLDDSTLRNADIQEFIKMMESGGILNKDSYGIFNSRNIRKEKGVVKPYTEKAYVDLLLDNFAIGHNRLATQGKADNNNNNHPFLLNSLILVHNGIISNDTELRREFNIVSDIETDSYVILHLIDHFIDKNKKDRHLAIIEAIQKTTPLLMGSFSVFLYDQEKKNIYYFKNIGTSFFFALIDECILLGSTSKENLEDSYIKKRFIFDTPRSYQKLIQEAENGIIYLINDKESIVEEATFEVKPSAVTYYNGITYPSYSELDDEGLDAEKIIGENPINQFVNIDRMLNTILGYIAPYDIVKENMIKIKNNDKTDFLKHYAEKKKGKYMFIPIEDIIYLSGEYYGEQKY